jgi:hypothetical protein
MAVSGAKTSKASSSTHDFVKAITLKVAFGNVSFIGGFQ